MTKTENYCTECGQASSATTPHCPECGAEDPWDERPAYRFDEDDLPYVFSYESYNDTYKLWKSFTRSYFDTHVDSSDVAGLAIPATDMKYCVFETWWVITESYEVEGPFLSKAEARKVAHDE